MSVLKSVLMTAAIASATGAVLAASSASADVVCNRWHECWNVHDRFDYPPGVGITFHTDDWRMRHRDWHWRDDHDGRGYYRNGVWIAF